MDSLQFKIVLMCSEHKSNVIRFKFFLNIAEQYSFRTEFIFTRKSPFFTDDEVATNSYKFERKQKYRLLSCTQETEESAFSTQ